MTLAEMKAKAIEDDVDIGTFDPFRAEDAVVETLDDCQIVRDANGEEYDIREWPPTDEAFISNIQTKMRESMTDKIGKHGTATVISFNGIHEMKVESNPID